jgi:3-hydroxyisobutyrate dehydrogenase-like beta-hydroxyacid dehydrogenase
MEVGVIGLGAMGKGLAGRLIKAGHRVKVWNRSPGPAEALAVEGATVCASAAEAATGEALVSMLANDASYREAFLAAGVLDAMSKDAVHINMATVSVALGKELAERHRASGVDYIAAPVMGRPDAAAVGQLHILAAGAPEALERARPLLEFMGQRIWPFGDAPEKANAAKIGANFMIGAAVEAMAEAMTLLDAYGVKASDFYDAMTNSAFAAPIYKNYGKRIVDGNYDPPGFKLALGFKDIRLALEASEAAAVPMPLASLLRDDHLDSMKHGEGDLDWAALAKVVFRRAKRNAPGG